MFGTLSPVVNRLFEDVLSDWGSSTSPSYPALNAWEDAEKYYVEAELPGFKIEDLELSALGRRFTIKGTRRPFAQEGWTCLRQERACGEFSRSVEFAAPIDERKVEAIFKNGVLSVTLPKAEAAKPRRIKVTS